ncbi:MAG: tRNA (N(6)-L-threonylcarbamoyladenosine(37)-C(2))-methylthiotransferase MtaB [SAR202 cluster bacterium]|nr:tRNA (N(6)-L-threonylcarbamoyladenosine(37)-C(2))-methylthiotransferase MtaB [SAR202 cluster bacterium]
MMTASGSNRKSPRIIAIRVLITIRPALDLRRRIALMPATFPRATPTVAIETHGCKLNAADSERLAREFAAAGFAVGQAQDADVFVLNSCTVTAVADRKARQALAAARRRRPDALIVASGCFAERSPNAVDALEAVDLTVTNRAKAELVGLVAARLGLGPRDPVASTAGVAGTTGRTRAFLRIQEGCDQVCAYCIVPRVRGRERSIPEEQLVAEVRVAFDGGRREVVLTGTQLGSYGFDLEGTDLRRLLLRLLRSTEMPRIRVSSLQPLELTEGLLELWSGEGRGRLCPHFHMPLQSGSDGILRRMRRRYSAARYIDAVERVKRAVPAAAVTTDIIAGFPGESDEDFALTVAVVREAELAGAHVFPYSARPGTSASKFPDQVPHEVKASRAAELRRLARAAETKFREHLVGQVRPVLWESDGPPLAGLTDNYVRVVAAPGEQYVGPNRIEEVELVANRSGHMVGMPRMRTPEK